MASFDTTYVRRVLQQLPHISEHLNRVNASSSSSTRSGRDVSASSRSEEEYIFLLAGAFLQCDTDNDGFLSRSQLRACLNLLGYSTVDEMTLNAYIPTNFSTFASLYGGAQDSLEPTSSGTGGSSSVNFSAKVSLSTFLSVALREWRTVCDDAQSSMCVTSSAIKDANSKAKNQKLRKVWRQNRSDLEALFVAMNSSHDASDALKSKAAADEEPSQCFTEDELRHMLCEIESPGSLSRAEFRELMLTLPESCKVHDMKGIPRVKWSALCAVLLSGR